VAHRRVPGIGGALHVRLADSRRAVDGGELAAVAFGFGTLGGRPLPGRPQLFQLSVELFDSGADLLSGPGRLAACDEIAPRAQRFSPIKTKAIEQAVELLPEGLSALIHLRLGA